MVGLGKEGEKGGRRRGKKRGAYIGEGGGEDSSLGAEDAIREIA